MDKWQTIPGSEDLVKMVDRVMADDTTPGLIHQIDSEFYLVVADFQVPVTGPELKSGLVTV